MTRAVENRIRIVHLIPSLQSGGAEAMLAKLTKTLDPGKFRNFILTLSPGGKFEQDLRDFGIEIHSIMGTRNWTNLPGALVRGRRHLRRIRPDIIQSWLYSCDFMGLLLAKLTKTRRLVWNIRCSELENNRQARLLARFSKAPRAVLVNSIAGKKAHERLGYRPRLWKHIPNGFDLDRFHRSEKLRESFRQEIGATEDDFVIGLVARFDALKSHGDFIEAARRFKSKYPRTLFVFAGRGTGPDEHDWDALIEENSLRESFRFLGERSDVTRILNGIDLSTSASTSEGFPNTLGESMACGTLCVFTDVGDCRSVLADDRFIVPSKDPEALSSAWERVRQMNPGARETVSRSLRDRIAAYYSIEVVTKEYDRFYTELMAAPE